MRARSLSAAMCQTPGARRSTDRFILAAMRNRILYLAVSATVILTNAFLVGCASQSVLKNAKATLELERQQIRELNEAFKSKDDKVITVPRVGEVECPERKCLLPVKATAERVMEGKGASAETVRGTVVLWGDVTQRLMGMLDQAQYTAKDQTAKGYGGEVTCNKAKCTFSIALDDKELRADGRAMFEEAPRGTASVEEAE